MKANSSLILGLKDLSQPEGQGQLKHDLTEQGEGGRPGVGVTKPIFSVNSVKFAIDFYNSQNNG